MSFPLLSAWVVFGLLVGVFARRLFPYARELGLGATVLLGLAGSFVGGLLGNFVAGVPVAAAHAAGMLGSVIGSVLVLALLSLPRGSVGT